MTTSEVSYNLAGSVRNMSLPVAGTTIVLYDYWTTGTGLVRHFLAQQTTGAKGEFSFDVRKGIYSVEVVPNKDTRFARQSFDTIRVNTNTIQMVSLKNGCIYSGTLRTASGEIISDAELHFFCLEPEALTASERVSDDGRFEITLPKGKYFVACKQASIPFADAFEGSRNSSRKFESIAFVNQALTVIDLWTDLREDLALAEHVSLKGTVTDSQGHPVSAVRVAISPSNQAEVPFDIDLRGLCFTDKGGHFECVVEPGTYDVKLEPGPDSHLSERRVGSILVDKSRTRTYSLGQGYRLYGQVAFEKQPVANALVSVSGGKIDSSTLTDAEGNFSFSLSGGRYEMTVTAQPDSLARLPFRLLAPFSAMINLAEDTPLDIDLQQGVMIAGKIVDKSEKVRPGVQLALYKAQDNESIGIDTIAQGHYPLAFAITGDDGSYEFRVLPGKYWIIVNNQQSTARLIEAREEDLELNLEWQTGCLVSFEIVSEFDEPVPHCMVYCDEYKESATKAEPVFARAGDDGICSLPMKSGIYSFRFEPPEQGSFQPKQIRQFSINCDVRRKVKLALKPAEAAD